LARPEFSLVRLEAEDKAKSVYAGVEPLKAEDIAECIRWALALPDHVNIDEIIVKCLDQASPNRINRR